MIEMRCPKCGEAMSIPEEQAGQNVSCPRCGNVTQAAAGAPPPPGAAQAGPGPAAPPAGPTMLTEKQSHTWAMLCHLGALAGLVGIPAGNILGPLIIWLIQKDKHPFVDEQGKEAVNFQISMTIYMIVAAVTIVVGIG